MLHLKKTKQADETSSPKQTKSKYYTNKKLKERNTTPLSAPSTKRAKTFQKAISFNSSIPKSHKISSRHTHTSNRSLTAAPLPSPLPCLLNTPLTETHFQWLRSEFSLSKFKRLGSKCVVNMQVEGLGKGAVKVPRCGDYNGEIMSGKPLDGVPYFTAPMSFGRTNMDDIRAVAISSVGISGRFLGPRSLGNFRLRIGKGGS